MTKKSTLQRISTFAACATMIASHPFVMQSNATTQSFDENNPYITNEANVNVNLDTNDALTTHEKKDTGNLLINLTATKTPKKIPAPTPTVIPKSNELPSECSTDRLFTINSVSWAFVVNFNRTSKGSLMPYSCTMIRGEKINAPVLYTVAPCAIIGSVDFQLLSSNGSNNGKGIFKGTGYLDCPFKLSDLVKTSGYPPEVQASIMAKLANPKPDPVQSILDKGHFWIYTDIRKIATNNSYSHSIVQHPAFMMTLLSRQGCNRYETSLENRGMCSGYGVSLKSRFHEHQSSNSGYINLPVTTPRNSEVTSLIAVCNMIDRACRPDHYVNATPIGQTPTVVPSNASEYTRDYIYIGYSPQADNCDKLNGCLKAELNEVIVDPMGFN